MIYAFFAYAWTIGLLLHASLSAVIIEAYDLKDVSEHFQNLDAQSLLLWDADSTLIIPSDMVLRPGSEDFLEQLEERYFADKDLREINWLISLMYHRMPFRLVDQEVKDLIIRLQKRSVTMLGLTAMHTGPFGFIDSMEEWRVNQLRLLGIDFSSVFPQHSGLEWEETSPFPGYPSFKEGIICCDRIPKGIVLTTFLQKIEWLPKQILFIDDNLDFLKSVQQAAENLSIPFIGVHYRAVEKMNNRIDEKLAHHQFQMLVEEEIWLSDEEAKDSMAYQSLENQNEKIRDKA